MTTPTMDLQRALAFSAYADRAFTADPALRDELDATVADPFEWSASSAAVAAIAADGDAPALARALRRLRRRVFLHT
ncbi:MAG: hypothetical protein WCB48_00375, partial [Casimicrobiaceae bacterium]